MKSSKGEIRIYVACLAAYNNGHLHGAWIDAEQEPSTIMEEVQAILATSPVEKAEEWAIHDYDGFEGATISEYESFVSVSEIAAFVAEFGELAGGLLGYFGDIEDARCAMEDHYCGQYRSLAEYAEELTDQTTDVPEHLSLYIDYEHMARDMAISDVITIETGFEQVHVFWSH